MISNMIIYIEYIWSQKLGHNSDWMKNNETKIFTSMKFDTIVVIIVLIEMMDGYQKILSFIHNENFVLAIVF